MQKETTTTKLDKGDEALKKYLLPGEEFKTNAVKTLSEHMRVSLSWRHVRTATEIANSLKLSGLFESVRVLDVAFNKDGILMTDYSAVVAKPKPQPLQK